jgi:MFS family permease
MSSRSLPQRIPARRLLFGILLLVVTTVGGYGFSYMTTYAQDSPPLAAGIAFCATTKNGLGNLVVDLLSGSFSDRIGRKPVMMVSIVLLLLLGLLAHLAMTQVPDALSLYAATSLLWVLQQLFGNAALVTITVSLPPAVRSG